jgi:hypothetical protein
MVLAGGAEAAESSSEDALKPTSQDGAYRFEHYELVTGKDRKPVELGRGAMGVTYKAFDVDLHRSVTLKVISEKYLGDESARLLTRSSRGGKRPSPKRCLGLPPGQNRAKLLLRDGVYRGGNARESHQTLRAA